MRSIPGRVILLSFLLFIFGLFAFSEVFSQSSPFNTATLPQHHTLDQRTIEVDFIQNLTGTTNTGQWTITINGVSIGNAVGLSSSAAGPYTASITPPGNQIFVKFDASGAAGHTAASPYVLTGETLKVSFVNTGNTLTTSGSGLAVLAFGPLTSKNTYAPAATGVGDILYQSEGIASVLDQCSPVNADYFRWTYLYSLRFRNSTKWTTANNLLHVSWGSGASASDLGGYLSNSGGDPSTTQPPVNSFTGATPGVYVSFRAGLNLTSAAAGIINVDGTNAFSYPDNTGVCNFRTTQYPQSTVAPIYSASGQATLQKNTQFNSYDYDDQNTGSLSLLPSVPPANGTTTSDLVCLGTNVGMKFTDTSIFNCIGDGTNLPTPGQGAAATPVNNQQRWVRFIYGGANSAVAASNIPNIQVAGTPVTDAFGNMLYAANPILPGSYTDNTPNASPMNKGYVVTGAGGLGVPDANGVIQLNVPATATTSGLISSLITTSSPVGQAVGQKFYVTIQYWGVCNPYPTSAPVENSTYFVQIITRPPAISFTPNPPNFCEGQANGNYVLTQSGGTGGTYKWYSTFPLVVAGDLEKTGATFNPVTEGTPAITKSPGATTTTNFFVTETLGNGCESLPTTVPFKVIKNVTGGTITHPGPNPICSGTVAAAFGSSALPTGGANPGTYTYQWMESTTSGSGYVPSVGTNATAATGFQRTAALTQTLYFVRQATSGPVSGAGTCTVALSNEIQITVHTSPTAGTVTADQTICESPGNPAAFTQTVAPTGGSGSYTYQWQSATAVGGPYVNIPLATGVTYDAPAGLLTTTFYQRVVTSGICATNTATSTPPIKVTVNNLVNAGTIGTAQSICSGDTPIGLTGTPATGGDGTSYTYQWEVSTTGPAGVYSFAPGASTSQNYNPPALTATPQHYNYRRKASSGLCSSVSSNIIQITVNALPTANVSGGGSVCAGNPAPDVVFTFTGSGPFDLVYAIGGVNQPVQNNITSPFNISNPGVGTYTIVSIADNNSPTCTVTAPSANITGSATVTISATPPPTVETFTPTAAVCDDAGATNPPDALLNLLPNSVQTYNIGYKLKNLNTLAETIVAPANFTSDAAGIVTIQPTYAQLGNAPEPLGYQIIITSIFNTVSLCAGAVPINGPTLIVNPRPAVPTGAVNNVSCSSGGGAALAVADPGVGFDIKWSTAGPALASFVAAAPGSGAESGTRTVTFTPTSSATATFYAFTRNTTTGCLSSTGVAVVQTQDTAPAAAAAGANQPNVCGLTSGSPVVTLASTAATNGGNGTWTVPGKIAYYQNFENFAVGTTTSTAYNGWTRDVSAANAYPLQGGSGYFEVKAGKRFEAQNTNGNLGGGAGNIGELVWSSSVFDISAGSGFPAVSAFVDVTNVSNDLDAGADADYVKVFYKLNGGAEIAFTTNGNLTGNFASATASVSGLSGSTLQIVIRVSTNAATETVAFDNIVVKDPTSTITFSDANSPTASVSNLPAPLPGGVATPTTLKWTVASALGACPTTSSNVTITINPLATTITITPQLCDDVTGAPFQAAGINMTTYSGSVSNAIGLGGTIDWYLTTGDRTAEINKVVAPITITNGQVLYFRAKRAAPLNSCANDGQTTFTVNALPAAIDKAYEFCEDAVNAGVATGINLTSFEMGALGVTSGGTGATRDVEWYEDNAGALGALITGASETNYSITATKTIHAKVIDLTSPVTPKCFDIADVVLTYKKKPVNNPLTGDGTVCTGTAIRVYQVSSATNNYGTVHNYNWTISGGGVSFEVFNGVGFVSSTNYVVTNTAFLLLVRYPNAGNFTITASETIDGCTGNTDSFGTIVSGAPVPLVFASPATQVCKGATQSYTLTSANGGSQYNWTVIGGTIIGSSTTIGSATINVIWGTSTLPQPNVSVTETNSNGCPGTPASIDVTLNDVPQMTSANNATICSGAAPSSVLPFVASPGTNTFSWKIVTATANVTFAGNAAIPTFPSGGSTGTGNVSHLLFNTSGVIGTVVYEVTPTEGDAPSPPDCSGNPQTVTITVNPEPVVNAVSNISVCSGDPVPGVTFSANTSGGETFNWTNTNTTIGLPGSGVGNIVGYTAPVNFSGLDIVGTISVTATKNSCTSAGTNAKTFTITIKPQPVVNAIPNVLVCAGDPISAITFSANTSGGETFTWTNTNTAVGLAASGTGNIAAFTAAANVTGANVSGIVTVTAAKNGCTSTGVNSKSFNITIKPSPVVAAVSNIVVCPGDMIGPIAFTANTGGGETFNWTNSNTSIGLAATGSGNIASYVAPANNTGSNIVATIGVSATAPSTCSGAQTTFTITIKPQPVVTTVSNISVCSGDPIAAINFAANTGGGETFNWTNTNTAIGLVASGTGGIAAYTAPVNISGVDIVGTITVSATKNSCTSIGGNTKSFTITIKPQPVVNAITNVSVCSGDPISAITFSANTAGGETFNWSNNNISIGLAATGTGNIAAFTAPNNFTGVDIVATITVTATKNSCVSTGVNTKSFTITVKPQPVVAVVPNVSVCSGDAISAINFSANTGGSETFNWTNTNTLIGLAASGIGNIGAYTAPNNFTGIDIVGTITVTATKNGCVSSGSNSKTFTVTIKPQPVVAAITNVSVCSGDAVPAINFSANTSGGETFNWTNSNPSIGLSANGTGNIGSYTAPNNFTGVDIVATLTVSATKNSCVSTGANTKSFTITIRPQPVVTTISNISVCSGDAVAAINFSANTGGAETFNWTNTDAAVGIALSGAGNIAAYTAPNNFTGADIVSSVTVTATKNSCVSAGANIKSFTITIKPQPVVAAITNISVCSGDLIAPPAFSANTGGSETFNWSNTNTSIGIGSTGTGNISSYTAPNNFTGSDIVGTITVTATKNGCTSTGVNSKTFTVTIRPQPVVAAITNVSVCSGGAISAINFSANTGGSEVFNWTNTNAAIGIAVSGSGNIVAYTAPINISGSDITGTITVSATKNSCTSSGANSKSFTITIKAEPVVTNVTDISVCSGSAISAVNFTANTSGGETFNWSNTNTGIGIAASGIGAIGSYTAPTNFTGADIVGTITVTATKNGCTSTGANREIFTITIKPEPVVTAIPDVSVCSGTAVAAIPFTANTLGGEIFNWTNTNPAVGLAVSGTGGIASYTAPINLSGSDIVSTITVTATKNGCTSAGVNLKTFTITIKPEPVVSTISNVSVCSGDAISAINFSANTGGSETFNWTNTNAAIGRPLSGTGNITAYTAPNNFTGADIVGTITVTATKNGCTSVGANTKSFTITIKPQPVVDPITVISVCSGDVVPSTSFTANTGGGETFSWSNNNTLIGIGSSGTGTIGSYTAPNNFTGSDIVGTITVTATKNGCTSAGANSKTFTITIKPQPVVTTVTNVSVCSGGAISTINFTANTGGSEVFNWTNTNTLIGLAASGTGDITGYTAPNNFTGADIVGTITVTATKNGCLSTGTNSKSFTITIRPQPVVNNISNITVCSGDVISAVSFGANTGGGETFTWSNTNTSIGLAGSGTGNIASYTAPTNTTLVDNVATITVSASKNSCVSTGGNSKSFVITIHPEPLAPALTTISRCSGQPINYDLQTIINGVGGNALPSKFTYTIASALPSGNDLSPAVFPGMFDRLVSSTALITETFSNFTNHDVTLTYNVVPYSQADNCDGVPFTLKVVIHPEPVGTDFTDPLCATTLNHDMQTQITNGIASKFTYTVSSDNGGVAPAANRLVASSAAITDVYTNTTGVVANITYTITAISTANNCTGALTFNYVAKIFPTPVGADTPVAAICSDTPFTINPQVGITNGVTISKYDWSANYNGLTVGGSAPPTGQTNATGLISGSLTNLTALPITAEYTITPYSGSCAGPSYKLTKSILPEPVGVNSTANINSDIILNYNLQNNVNTLGNALAANFSWVAAANASVSGESTTPQLGSLISDVLNNVTSANQTVIYTVTPTGTNGCTGDPFTITVTVLPEPVGVNDALTINSDVANTYNLQNNVNSVGNAVPSTFVWTALPNGFVTGESTAPQSGGTISDVINNVTGIDQIVQYTVTPTGTNGVVGNSFTILVTVRSEPVGANDGKTVCSDVASSYDLQNNLNTLGNGQAATFSWVAASNSNVTGESTTPQTGPFITDVLNNVTNINQVVSYTVTPTGVNGCPGNPPFQINITVKPEPVVASTLNETKCSDQPYGKLLTTNGVSIGAASYDVTVVSKDAGITGGRALGLIGAGASPDNIISGDSYTNKTATPLKVVYRVVPNGTNGCVGDPKLIEFTINPEPVLSVATPPDMCSTNLNSPTSTNIVLGTNGTSINASLYRVDQILYNGAVAAPAGFSFPGSNKTVSTSGGINHIKDDQFTNTSLLPVVVSYTITPISSTGCEGDPSVVTINVNPEPKLDPSLSPTPICSGDKIDPLNTGFELRSQPAVSVAASSFILRGVSFPGMTAGASNATMGAGKNKDVMDNDTYINITTGPLTATYTIAPVSAAGCVGADQTVVITVNPAPAMKSGLDRIVCNGAVSNVVLQDNSPTTIGAINYDIISINVPGGLTADAGNATIGLTSNVNRIKNDKFVNSTNDRIIVTYQVVPVSVAGCRGPQAVITLTVEPQATSSTINATSGICSGSAINLTFASPTYSGAPTDPVVTFSYSMVAVSGITGNTLGNNLSEGTVITDVLVNSTDNPITVHYKVTPRAAAAANGAGCTGTIEDVAVVVQPRPKITSINNKTVCENEPINLNLVSTTVPSTGSIKFFVTAVPSSGNVTGFTNNSFIANSTLLADALANNGAVTESVTYTIEPRNVNGANATICAGPSIDVVVTVSPRPNITPIADFSICSGEPFNPIAIVTDTETAIPGSTLVTWTATPEATITGESNGAGNSFSQVLFNNSGDKKTVVYTINAKNISNSPSCSGTPITLNVTVYPIPKVVSLPSSVNVCNNGTLTPNPYVLTSSAVASLSPVFDWTIDDGGNPDLPDLSSVTNGTTINQTFVNNGSFLGTYQYTITPHLTIPASANPIGSNTCTGQDGIMVVNVAPPVNGEIYGFDITGAKANTLFLCKGSNEFIYIDPVGLPLMEVKYKEGSTEKTLTKLGGLNILKVSPSVTTVYELISVKDKFGCVKDINQTVTVNVDAVSNEFSVVGPEISCSPFQVQFKHDQVAGVNYTWKWLDGPDSTTYQATSTVAGKIIKHTFANPSPSTQAKFKVSLEAFLDTTKYLAGCKKLPFVKEIKIYPTISTGVFPDNTVLCSGETVKFVNTSQGVSASGHKWFYRVLGSTQELDVLTTANVSYTLVNASASNPIIYEVVYRATNGNCPAADVVTPITVYRGANPGFNEGVVPPYIGGHSIVTYTNTTVPIDVTDFRYEWEFGTDGKPSTGNGIGPFTIDYTTPGEKDVVLTVTNTGAEADGRSCVSEFRKTINILLLPLASSFKATPQAACFPSNITVTENTATGDLMEWKVVDSNGRVAATSNADLPVFEITNPGKYSIFLKTSSSFTGQVANSQQDNFEIYPTPVASFDARPTLLFVPDTELNTFNFTTGATDYLWDFGDNGTSTEQEPKYKYKIEGVYDLTLIASNDHGNGVVCYDTLSRKITAKQGGVTKVPNAFTPNPNGSNGGVSTNGSFNDVFLPYVKGAEEFNMQIFDRWGNLIFESNNSTIGWDGYDRHGRLLPSGVYVYKLTLRLSDGQRTTQIGDITMIR